MPDLLTLLAKAEKLPPGHVDKAKAEEAVKKVYSPCHEVVRKWDRRIYRIGGFKIQGPMHALIICNTLCALLGQRPIRKILLNSPDVDAFASAHYCYRKIHFKSTYISWGTLLHELAHHFEHGIRSSHDFQYVEILDFLCRVFYERIIGKKLHSDW